MSSNHRQLVITCNDTIAANIENSEAEEDISDGKIG